MKEQLFGTIGKLKTPIRVYDSLEEILQHSTEEVLVSYLNSHCAYRGPCQTGRDILCDLIEGETGVERLQEDTGKKDSKTGEAIMKYTESPETYLNRVMTEKGLDDLTQYQEAYNEACRNADEEDSQGQAVVGLEVDIRERPKKERQPKKFSKLVENTAKQIFEKGDEQVQKAVALCAKAGYTLTLVGDSLKEGKLDMQSVDFRAVCTGIKAYNDWKAKQQQQEFVA